MRKTSSPVGPAQVLDRAWAQDFVVGLRVPDVGLAHRGEGAGRQTQLWDESGTCVTLVSHEAWWEHGAVTCYGPRNLWEEVVAAYTEWRGAGQPGLDRHGLTVTADGTQHAWRDAPAQAPGSTDWSP